MIKSLSIHNFQCHKSSVLDLLEGVNVIVGSSDSGKSSIIRALQWLVFNRPSGDSFRSCWGGDTKVTVESETESFIQREKTKNTNSYKRIITPGDVEEFKAMGQGVPDEISSALNLTAINIQTQHDPPFLLSQSSGEVARYLNELVNLDKIDSSLSYINRGVRGVKSDIVHAEGVIAGYKVELESYDWVDKADDILSDLEKKEKQLSEMEDLNNQLEILVVEIQAEMERVADLEVVIEPEKRVNELLNIYTCIDTAETERDQLTNICEHILGEQTWVHEYDQLINLDKKVSSLIKTGQSIIDEEEEEDSLYQLKFKIEGVKLDISTYQDEIVLAEETFDELMPDQCPLCGGKV